MPNLEKFTKPESGIFLSVENLPSELICTCKKLNCKKSKKQRQKRRAKEPVVISKIGLFVSEFIGTALLLFLGCMGCLLSIHGIPIPAHFVAISFGLTIMIIIMIFGHISGAHLNPAVTIASVFLGYLKPESAIVYFAAQFSGAILGFGALKALIPREFTVTEVFDEALNETTKIAGLCSTMPHEKVSSLQATLIEAIATAVLILICCSIWDKRNASKSDSLALKFGLAVSGLAMVTGPFTGCSMNTARSFAPALLNGDWHAHWVYWIGPTFGAIVAASFYKFMYFVEPDYLESQDDDGTQLERTNLRKDQEDNKV